MSTYKSLGIRPIINANATLTRLGGSLMPPEVLKAMNEAAHSFVDLPDLQEQVGKRLAQLTRNEAAYVSSGAAAGLVLATAVCVTECNPDLIQSIPYLKTLKNEIVIQHIHRNGFEYAVQQVGGKIVEFGDANGATSLELRQAISPKTAAIFWFQGIMNKPWELPLADVIAVAKEHNIPVVVDAAAQLPPVENLWRFTEMGASLVIFSGGKDLQGPQSSGLILGESSFINAIKLHGTPNLGVGRPMKVGKEEMMGLLAAVERYITMDHEARERYCEDTTTAWCEALNGIHGIQAVRDFPNEAGQPLPWCLVTMNPDECGITRNVLLDTLIKGEPAIDVAPFKENQFHINPMTLQTGEEQIITNRLLAILSKNVS